MIVPVADHDPLFSMIATLQVFAEPTTLRPLTNTLSTTWTPLMKVYRDAFTRDDIYSAAATSVIIAHRDVRALVPASCASCSAARSARRTEP